MPLFVLIGAIVGGAIVGGAIVLFAIKLYYRLCAAERAKVIGNVVHRPPVLGVLMGDPVRTPLGSPSSTSSRGSSPTQGLYPANRV